MVESVGQKNSNLACYKNMALEHNLSAHRRQWILTSFLSYKISSRVRGTLEGFSGQCLASMSAYRKTSGSLKRNWVEDLNRDHRHHNSQLEILHARPCVHHGQ